MILSHHIFNNNNNRYYSENHHIFKKNRPPRVEIPSLLTVPASHQNTHSLLIPETLISPQTTPNPEQP